MRKVFCLLKALKDQSLVICVKLLVVIPALIAHLQSSFVIHPKLTFPKTPSPRITSGICNFRWKFARRCLKHIFFRDTFYFEKLVSKVHSLLAIFFIDLIFNFLLILGLRVFIFLHYPCIFFFRILLALSLKQETKTFSSITSFRKWCTFPTILNTLKNSNEYSTVNKNNWKP